MSTAYIALGSNLDNPANQLQSASRAIASLKQSSISAISSVYRSAAVGPGDQSDYLNAVLELRTELPPLALLDHLQRIEMSQGRVRTVRWGARTLDLDIALYDDLKINSDRLTIPHPAMQQRHFVLYPLAEIAGENLVLPCGAVLGTLLTHCPREDLVLTELTLSNYPETD